MSWKCPCGASNRDSKTRCKACQTPKGVVWSPPGVAYPGEARLFAKVADHGAPTRADRLGLTVKILWTAALIMGAWVGFSLARIKSSSGHHAMKAVFNSWKNLPWTLWGDLTTRFGTEVLIGTGIILPLFFFVLPRHVRQSTFTLLGHVIFAVIAASVVGAITYFVGVFVYDLGPYFGFG